MCKEYRGKDFDKYIINLFQAAVDKLSREKGFSSFLSEEFKDKVLQMTRAPCHYCGAVRSAGASCITRLHGYVHQPAPEVNGRCSFYGTPLTI